MARSGARPLAAAPELNRQVHAAPRMQLRGAQVCELHCMLEPDRDTQIRHATEAVECATSTHDLLRAHWLPARSWRLAGTGTYNITRRTPAVTELQADSYLFIDAFRGNLMLGFDVSLTALARRGETLISDAGRKSVGIGSALHPIQGYDCQARYCAEEHALFDTDPAFLGRPGNRKRLVWEYAPTAVNLHDVIFVVEDDQAVDVWPVFPRGHARTGFVSAPATSV
jgi:D-serine deaminase-like pyridoxal phosphate-dependent protein